MDNDDDAEWVANMISELDQSPSDDENQSEGPDLVNLDDFASWNDDFSASEGRYPDDLSEVNITEPCNDRIVQTALSTPLQEKLNQLQERLILYTTDYYIWQPVYQKDGVISTKREGYTKENHKTSLIRGQIFVPYSITDIIDVLVDSKYRQEIDPYIVTSPPISWISDHTGIEYVKYKPIWPTEPRDSCKIVHWRLLKNGLFLWYGFSEQSELYPEQEGVVRSKLDLAGYVMKHVPGGTMLFLIVEADLGGKIPQSVASLILVSKPLCLLNLRKILERQYPPPPNAIQDKFAVYPSYDDILRTVQNRKKVIESSNENLWNRYSVIQIEQFYRNDSNLLYQGLLLRRSNKTLEWNIYYFTLDKEFLHHFLHVDDEIPFQSFHLNSSDVQIICHNEADTNLNMNGMGIYPFEISHVDTSTYYLAAQTSTKRQEWLEYLQRARHTDIDADPRSSFTTMTSSTTPQFNEKTQKFFSIDLHSIPFETAQPEKVFEGLDETLIQKLDSVVVALMKSHAVTNKRAEDGLSSSDDDGWAKVFEGSGLKCFRRMDSGGLMSIRGEVFFPYTIPEIFGSLLDRQLRLKVQPDIDACPPVKWLSRHTGIEYLRYKAVWPTAPRDYCNLLHWRLLTDGTFLLFAISEPSHHYPTQPGLVRANLYVGGYVMEHVPGGTKVSLLVQVDIGGHIPKPVANFVIAKRPAMLLNLKASLDRAWKGKERPDLSQPSPPEYQELFRIATEVEESSNYRTSTGPASFSALNGPSSFSETPAPMPVLTEVPHRISLHTYLKEGILYKQTDILKHWNPRYFTLDDSFLHYYHNIDDPLPRRSLQITKGMQIISSEIKVLNGIECFLFVISHPESLIEYHLAACSEIERQRWMSALINIIRDRTNSSGRISESEKNTNISTDAIYEEQDYHLENYINDQPHQNFEYGLSTSLLELIKELETNLLSHSHMNSNWNLISEKEDIQIHCGMHGIREETVLPFSIPEIYSILSDPDSIKALDGKIENCRRLENLNLHTWYEYQLFKFGWPLSPRDYCLLVNWRLLRNGTFLYVISSQQHVKCPQVEGVVRETRILDGFILKPMPEGTQIVYISHDEGMNGEEDQRPSLLGNLRRMLHKRIGSPQFQPSMEIWPELIKISESNIDEDTLDHLKNRLNYSQHDEDLPNQIFISQNPTHLRFDLTKTQEQKLENVASRLMQFYDQNSLRDWEYLDEKEGVTIHRRIDTSGMHCIRGEAILPFTIPEIFNLLRHPGYKRLLDRNVDIYFSIDVINLHTHYEYIKLKGTWPLSPRDYCLLSHWRLLTDGTLLTFSFSDDISKCPPFSGVVRGDIHLNGFILKHVVGGTKVVYFTDVDLQATISRNFQSKAMILNTMTTVLRTLSGKNQSYDQRMYHAPPLYDDIAIIVQKHTDSKTFRKFQERFQAQTQSIDENYVNEIQVDEISQPYSPFRSSITSTVGPSPIYDPSTILPIQRIRLCVIFAMGLIFLQLFVLPVSWTLISEILFVSFIYYTYSSFKSSQKSFKVSTQHIYRFKFDTEKLSSQLPPGVDFMVSPFIIRALGRTLCQFPQFHGQISHGRFHPMRCFNGNFSISFTDCSFLEEKQEIKMIEIIDVNHKQFQEINTLCNLSNQKEENSNNNNNSSDNNGLNNLSNNNGSNSWIGSNDSEMISKFSCFEVFPILISKLFDLIYSANYVSLSLDSSDALAHVIAINPLNRTLSDLTLLPSLSSETLSSSIQLMFTNHPLSSMIRRKRKMITMTLVINSSQTQTRLGAGRNSSEDGLKFVNNFKEQLQHME